MTKRTKSILRSVIMVGGGAIATAFALTMVGCIGKAFAQTPGAVPTSPGDLATALYTFVVDGAHLPAVGAAIMLVVWGVRTLGTKIPKIGPWFKTKLGGYVLGFSIATLSFVGPALMAGQAITLGLITQAIGTGFAASGKWEGLMDILGLNKKEKKS